MSVSGVVEPEPAQPKRVQSAEYALLLDRASVLLSTVLDTLRLITPEGWETACYQANLVEGWNANDVAMLRAARLLSMRGGPRFKPPPAHGGVVGE